MTRSSVAPQLDGLIEELRRCYFPVSPDHYLAAEKVLLAIAASQDGDAIDAVDWLAPIFSTSVETQETFDRVARQWATPRLPAGTPDQGPLRSRKREDTPQKGEDKPAISLRTSMVFAGAGLLAFLGMAGGLWYWHASAWRQLTGEVRDRAGNPVAGAGVALVDRRAVTDATGQFTMQYRISELPDYLGVSSPNYLGHVDRIDSGNASHRLVVQLDPLSKAPRPQASPQQSPVSQMELQARPVTVGNPTGPSPIQEGIPAWVPVAALCLPLFTFGFWQFWQHWPRWYLRGAGASAEPRLEAVRLRGITQGFLAPGAIRRAAHALQRRRESESQEIDVARTIEATLRNAGWFTPIETPRRTVPEYLVLIDRLSLRDQRARFEDELMRALSNSGVFVERFYYHSDPRTCWSADGARKSRLEELSARYPGHILVIYGDGAALIDGVTRRLHQWMSLFQQWQRRALLSPVSSPAVTRIHQQLASDGFLVLPARLASLEWLGAGFAETNTAPRVRWAEPYPSLLDGPPEPWLSQAAPAEASVSRLMVQFQRYLGESGLKWLAACAVYPELHWDLTLYLGYTIGGAEMVATRLDALVRLPWFRHGYMPDWLRIRLIGGLSPDDQGRVRGSLQLLLARLVERGGGRGFELQIATDSTAVGRWRRRLVAALLRTARPGSPLRDYVFLSVMTGQPDRNLILEAPDALRRAVFRGGMARLGLRPALQCALAVLAGASLFAALRPLVRSDIPPIIGSVFWPGAPAGIEAGTSSVGTSSVQPQTKVPVGGGAGRGGVAASNGTAATGTAGGAAGDLPGPVASTSTAGGVPNTSGPATVASTSGSVSAPTRTGFESPLGIVVQTAGGTLLRAGGQLPITAIVGDLLFAGDTLSATKGQIRFAFCPRMALATLGAGMQVQLSGNNIGKLPTQPVEFCTLPAISRTSTASVQDLGAAQRMDTAADQNLESLPTAGRAQLAVIDAALARDRTDLLAALARAALLQQYGLTQAAISEYYKLRDQFNVSWVATVVADLRASALPFGRVSSAPATPPAGKTYALVAGISRYRNAPALLFAHSDANTFAAFLQSPRGGGLSPANQLILLTNDQVTTAGIRVQLETLISRSQPGDTIIFYYAGISLRDANKQTYLLTADADPQDLRSTGILIQDLRDLLERQQHRARVLVYLETCCAAPTHAAPGSKDYYYELDATRATEQAYESPNMGGGHGVFTYFLLDGLNGSADTNRDGVVDAGELTDYVRQNVVKATASKQHPLATESIDPSAPLSRTDLPGILLPGWTPLQIPLGKR